MEHKDPHLFAGIRNAVLHVSPLSDDALHMLISRMESMEIPAKTNLLPAGKRCDHIYFIEKGACRMFYDNGSKEINTGFYFEHHFFTSLQSLRSAEPSAYSIETLEPSVIWRCHKDSMTALYGMSTEITAFGRQLLEKMLEQQEAHVRWIKSHTTEERYQYILDHRTELLQRVSLTQLSSYLGTSRETLSRIRARLM